MAGHLPIPTDETLEKILKSFLKKQSIYLMPYYQRYEHSNGKMYRLPKEYFMDEEHGLKDEEVIALSYEDKIYEYHLDKDLKINQIYLVM
jgi:hypothetical protein